MPNAIIVTLLLDVNDKILVINIIKPFASIVSSDFTKNETISLYNYVN